MNRNQDHSLIAFHLGELGVRDRLDVRLRLAFSPKARRRLAELERASEAIAGAIVEAGAPAFQANRRVRLRRQMTIDALASIALAAALTVGGACAIRAIFPPLRVAPNCAIDAGGHPVAIDAKTARPPAMSSTPTSR